MWVRTFKPGGRDIGAWGMQAGPAHYATRSSVSHLRVSPAPRSAHLDEENPRAASVGMSVLGDSPCTAVAPTCTAPKAWI